MGCAEPHRCAADRRLADRPTPRFCAPASRSSSIPAGRPIGATRRFRRAAETRFLRFGQRQIRHRIVARAGTVSRTAPAAIRSAIWITSSCRCGSRRKTRRSNPIAETETRLRHLRQYVRAGGVRVEARAQRRRRRRGGDRESRDPRAAARRARRTATPSAKRWQCSTAATARASPSSPCIASPARAMIVSSSKSRRPPARRSICSPKGRRRTGRCRCPSSRAAISGPTRQFTFDLDGLPPGAHAQGATLTFTAVSERRRHRGFRPARLIRANDDSHAQIACETGFPVFDHALGYGAAARVASFYISRNARGSRS